MFLDSILQHTHQCVPECTPPLPAPIEIHVKWGLQKAKFLAYKVPGWFGTAIFLKFRIFLIILAQQRYMVTLKVPRKWLPKLHNNSMPIQETESREMLPEDVLSKITRNNTTNHLQNLFFHWDGVYGPYEEDFTKCLNNYDHYMQFLSTQFGKGHTLLCLAQNTGVFTRCLKCFGGVVSSGNFWVIFIIYSIKLHLYQSYMMIKSGHNGLQLPATPIMHIAYILLSTEDSTDMLNEEFTRYEHNA